MTKYDDQDYDVLIVNDYSFVLLTIKVGSMCDEMVKLIEDTTDDDCTESKEHAELCLYVLNLYSKCVKTVGDYSFSEISSRLEYDYAFSTDVDLDDIISKNGKFYIDISESEED